MYNSNTLHNSEPNVSTERQVLTWLRKRIHPYCWGQSDRHKQGVRQISKRQITSFFSSLRFDLPRRYLPKMTNSLMMGHFVGMRIVYFQSNGKYSIPETLICIDIDCHDRGTYEGACACVKWLIVNGFPALFWSRSTNGRGIHAYVWVDKRRYDDQALDIAISNLERWLRYQHAVHGWNIEQVEVKGRPPVFVWGVQKYELLDVRMGTLAKLPVDAIDRPEKLMATTCLSIPDMNRLGREVPGEWTGGGANCTTYRLPLSTPSLGEIDPVDLKPFVPSPRDREWPLWVERMAQVGLVEEDSMSEVVFELAKWLLWVELYGEDDREALTIELLQKFVLEKHNGFVTRLNQGKDKEVLSHVERVVEGACEMSPESKELFLRIRQRRQQGKYKRPIKIVPILEKGREDVADEGRADGAVDQGYTCTTYSLPLSPVPLPQDIEERLVEYARGHRMRRSEGEYPLVRFARQLLGILWHNRGSARIHTDDLTGMAGNVHQQDRYKTIFRGMHLIRDWTGTYRLGSASSLYRLTDEARRAYEAAFAAQVECSAV